jgi:hypothetical protein
MNLTSFTLIVGIVLSSPAIAQDADHIRIGNRIYDIRNGSYTEGAIVAGGSIGGLQTAREALVEAGCLRPDEPNLSRHDCYINRDGKPVHRPARDSEGQPQGDTALCRDGTYSFSKHTSGTCSRHGGVQRWD